MKISVFDMDNLKNPHWAGGQAKVTSEIFTRLSSRHDVTVYTSKYPNCRDYILSGVKYVHIGLGSRYPRLNNLAFLIAQIVAVSRIKSGLVLENFTAPFSVGFLPLFTRVPVIGLTSFFASKQLQGKYKLPFSLVTRYGLRCYKFVIALTELQAGEIAGINSRIKLAIINNGVSNEYLTYKTEEKDYILYMGRIDINHKGLDYLIEAYSKISDRIPEKLYIMGGTTDERELASFRQLIDKHGLSGRVVMLGKKGGTEKAQILAGAKLFLTPSRYESQSLSSLEALAMGKALVCFDIPGFTWISPDACVKIAPFNVSEYSMKISELLNDADKRRSIGAHARALANNYSWDSSAKKYEDFLESITQSQ